MKSLHDNKQNKAQLVVRSGLCAGQCQADGTIPAMKCEYICEDQKGTYKEGIRCTEEGGRFWDEVVSRIYVN
ncbi:hypothetical protein BGS_0622 [Beggiatoa sp. SS]|nr:hypothetical protein BGS_0622 [Beggiatoa sp. SS]